MWTVRVADAGLAVPAAELHPGEAGGHLAFQPAASAVPHLNPPPPPPCPAPCLSPIRSGTPPASFPPPPPPQLYPLPTPSLQYTHIDLQIHTPHSCCCSSTSCNRSLAMEFQTVLACVVALRSCCSCDDSIVRRVTKVHKVTPPPPNTHTHTLRENH